MAEQTLWPEPSISQVNTLSPDEISLLEKIARESCKSELLFGEWDALRFWRTDMSEAEPPDEEKRHRHMLRHVKDGPGNGARYLITYCTRTIGYASISVDPADDNVTAVSCAFVDHKHHPDVRFVERNIELIKNQLAHKCHVITQEEYW